MKTTIVKTDPCPGYAIVVGGAHPYVSDTFFSSIGRPNAKDCAELMRSEPYHSAQAAVILTLADYRRLLQAAKGQGKP